MPGGRVTPVTGLDLSTWKGGATIRKKGLSVLIEIRNLAFGWHCIEEPQQFLTHHPIAKGELSTMRIKHVLYLAIIVGLLASMGAIPVLAEEGEDGDIPMWVHRARLTYTGRSSNGSDMMVAYIHIRDAELNMVEEATVFATWTLPDGTVLGSGIDDDPYIEAITNLQGIAIFELFAGAGEYKICVTDVTKTDLEPDLEPDWEYVPGFNRETCATYLLPPFPVSYPH